MKILFLAPQPFYQERGTTIAIDMLLSVLSQRGHSVRLLTYHIGQDRDYRGIEVRRVRPPFAPASIKPGFSLAKLYCDLFLAFAALRECRRNDYGLLYSVEEAGFIAATLHRFFGIPYAVDMDSLMSDQIIEKYPKLRVFHSLLKKVESWPLKRASAVVPMCEDLASFARRFHNQEIHVLRDVSLVSNNDSEVSAEDIRTSYGIASPILLYVGNLEEYQGIDLLLMSISELKSAGVECAGVVIGGSDTGIKHYTRIAEQLGIDDAVWFIGPRPVTALGHYLSQADVLVSPRVKGTNTPMKIYSYLDSGVPVVATALPTHTQVISAREASLFSPDPQSMADAIKTLLANPEVGERLVRNARDLIAQRHSPESFTETVNEIFDSLQNRISKTN